MEYENKFTPASKGVAGTALGLSIGALGVEALRGGFGNILGNNNCTCNEDHYVNRFEAEQQATIARLQNEISLRDANTYVDGKILELYKYVDAKFGGVEAQISQQGVFNAQVTANLACQQNTINLLMGLTKTIIPIDNICPTPAVATTTTGA